MHSDRKPPRFNPEDSYTARGAVAAAIGVFFVAKAIGEFEHAGLAAETIMDGSFGLTVTGMSGYFMAQIP